MSRLLHFGCDQNRLPAPWENFDLEVDIRKPLPFAIGSASVILAEHVIEHVSFKEGLAFLRECWRVLEPGGTLRLAFPDILNEIPIEEYRVGFEKFYTHQLNCQEDVWLSILTDWAHESCWTMQMGIRVLKAVGFEVVTPWVTGRTSHPVLRHKVDLIPRAETTALEAVR